MRLQHDAAGLGCWLKHWNERYECYRPHNRHPFSRDALGQRVCSFITDSPAAMDRLIVKLKHCMGPVYRDLGRLRRFPDPFLTSDVQFSANQPDGLFRCFG